MCFVVVVGGSSWVEQYIKKLSHGRQMKKLSTCSSQKVIILGHKVPFTSSNQYKPCAINDETFGDNICWNHILGIIRWKMQHVRTHIITYVTL